MIWERPAALAMDAAMCAMMYAIQRRHRLEPHSGEALERYIAAHEALDRDAYFPAEDSLTALTPQLATFRCQSPIITGFAENDHAHFDLYPCAAGWRAPTVIFLHALMSASDIGYRRWAADFNARGWNAVFMHLPFHYSRTPRGHWNGELAITADLVRSAEGLRQGVAEARQLMAHLRAWGCREFGLWASSYGGWIGGLLASVEADFRFIALMEPIVDVEHAIWTSPAGLALRRELRRAGIGHPLIERHFRLVSPLHGEARCGGERVILCGGTFDHIAPAADIARLHRQWAGSAYFEVPQGHFGYRMMREMWARLVARGWI